MAIRLSVLLRNDLASSEVSASGFELVPLTDEAAAAFGIPRQIVGRGYDDQLWGVIKNWWGRVPDEFVTSDPIVGSMASVPHRWTPYKDSWGEDKQVRVERKAVGCRLVESYGSVDAMVSTEIENRDTAQQDGQEAELLYEESVSDSRYSESSWSLSLSNGMEVEVGGEFAGFEAGAKRTIELTVEYGETSGHSRTVETSRGIRLKAQVNAAPKTVYPVSVQAGKGALKVAVDYEYRLMGYWRALYIQRAYNGQLAAPLSDVGELLRALGKPEMVRGSDILSVGFVTDGKISIGEGRPI